MKTGFRKSIHTAVRNATLSGALGRFSEAYKISRAKAYEGIDFEALRSVIADRKSFAASNLERLVAEFTRNAEASGAKVFVTNDPERVKDYILRVARENDVKTVVKSKSMASEEIHLNGFLEKNGVTVQETDLGEWIIQLAGQKPSHMVLPAIHMTKEEVSDLFSKEVDERLSNDIPKLVEVARREMRPKFLTADMGITGANIAVAETGSIVLVTNEGNARMVTTLPKIHIALVGIEKLVDKFEDIIPILTALPRSATGQLQTSYVSIISGPTPNTGGTSKDLHIILMDNRRTEMAGDPRFKQAMQCIRCGSCLNVCPIFRIVGGHVFGSVYTGGIGAILTAWFDELQKSEDIQGLCIQCGNCKEVCPGSLDIPEMIMELRRRLVKEKGLQVIQKSIFTVVNNRRLFHAVLRAASVGGKPLSTHGYIRHLPLFLSKLTDGRSLPAIAMVPFRDRFRKIKQPRCKETAALFAGCLIDFAYPEMGEAIVAVLNKAGIEVTFPEKQTCCGAPARYSGAYEVAEQNAIDNIKALLKKDVTYVVSACPTCTVALTRDFAATFESVGQSEWMPQAKKLAEKTIDFSTLVKKLVDEGRLTLENGHKLGKVTYHDSCHMKRTLNVFEQPRALLKKAGYDIVEMFECNMCCGMGGSYSIKLPEIAAPILARKLTNIKNTGASIVATDCPGCVMQLRGGMDQDGADIEVKHTVELLVERLRT
jgi:iron-sulfur cluster protein